MNPGYSFCICVGQSKFTNNDSWKYQIQQTSIILCFLLYVFIPSMGFIERVSYLNRLLNCTIKKNIYSNNGSCECLAIALLRITFIIFILSPLGDFPVPAFSSSRQVVYTCPVRNRCYRPHSSSLPKNTQSKVNDTGQYNVVVSSIA